MIDPIVRQEALAPRTTCRCPPGSSIREPGRPRGPSRRLAWRLRNVKVAGAGTPGWRKDELA